ncbi:MAG TPA: circadian clock protein KaiC [Anaeromyxobacteraceae bacterium]|nr:circadian clock protein KaiC [Anaeromyxobacteraceae bacterium]
MASGRTTSIGRRPAEALAKAPSGIQGLDEITGGGLPRGRPTLVCGGAGCGKTLFALEFLVRGATEHGEPGAFLSFEETEPEIVANVAPLGFDIRRLQAKKKLFIDWIRVERSEIEETGDYDLEGLFVRLQHAIDQVKAKRVALDTVESLFSALPNPVALRSELRRLFRWLKDRGVTAVITAERGEGTLTRHGLEEYVSDCVIFLDHRVGEQVSTRRLRVVKYRGSTHGTNEYPFLIDENGISVLPITSMGMDHPASRERVTSGIARLDAMLGGKGYFRGSTVLVSGTAGTGKTSIAAALVRATCESRRRCLYLAFEESAAQLTRNMRSIGIHLDRYVKDGALRLLPVRPNSQGLETHLLMIHKAVAAFDPAVVIMDPITNLVGGGDMLESRQMLTRLIDFLKTRGITGLFTSLTAGTANLEETDVGVSSLIDTWLLLEVIRSGGERNRALTIIKSRGMAHSNQSAEYRLSPRGVEIRDTYVGPGGVLTGSARLAREAEERAAALVRDESLARQQALRASRRKAFERRLETLRAEFAVEDAELERAILEDAQRGEAIASDQMSMAKSRQAFSTTRTGRDGAR